MFCLCPAGQQDRLNNSFATGLAPQKSCRGFAPICKDLAAFGEELVNVDVHMAQLYCLVLCLQHVQFNSAQNIGSHSLKQAHTQPSDAPAKKLSIVIPARLKARVPSSAHPRSPQHKLTQHQNLIDQLLLVCSLPPAIKCCSAICLN